MDPRHIFSGGALIVAALVALAPRAAAQDLAAGQTIARAWCADCHAVGARPSRVTDAAPPFVAIANRPDFDAQGMRAWLLHPRPPMPPLELRRTDIEALVDYMESLRGR